VVASRLPTPGVPCYPVLVQELELTADRPRARGLSLLPPPQRRFGRYELLCRFASGGMANLYLARFCGPGGFNKLVAIKRIHEHLTDDEDFVGMFVDEARLAARIEHPNVVQVIELGAVDTSYFIAMEYVPGESLVALLRRAAPPLEVSARIISQAALGLHAAHELRDAHGEPLQVVHRDVSPGNILVSYQGVVKVTDFGVARASSNIHTTAAGTVKGKFAYMSPEQARSGSIDRRADIFALGIVLYEITTRRRLFKSDSDMVTMAKVLNETIAPPSEIVDDYPQKLEEVVMGALQRDPQRRYQTAQAFHEALESFIAASGAPVLQSTIGELMQRNFADRIAEKEQFLRLSEDELAGEVADLTASEGSSATSFQLEGTVSFARWLRRRRRVVKALAVSAAASVALLVLGYVLVRAGSERRVQPQDQRVAASASLPTPARRAAPVRPTGVRILVKVLPHDARVVFDGQVVSNPHRAQLKRGEGQVHVVASAPGYQTRRFDVPLTESSRWVIALDRVRPEPVAVADHDESTQSSRVKAPRGSKTKRRPKAKRKGRAQGANNPRGKRLFDNPY
jgi:serine/threonine protein kinase